jgi:DNA-binding CsgD family transcriptional regulator
MTQPRPLPRALTADDVVAIARSFSDAPSVEALAAKTQEVIQTLGFMGYTFAILRRVKSVYLHARLIHSWPVTVQAEFEQPELFNHDPVILRSRQAVEPFVWDFSVYDPERADHAQILAFRKRLGVAGGVTVPIIEAFQGRSVLFLSGVDFDTSAHSLLCLRLIGQHLAACFNALKMGHEEEDKPGGVFRSEGELSPREREVCGWIAFGKSSRDVAGIMKISEHTVNEHIASAMAKLKASNRTEAVMRALLTNQIDLR